MDAGEPCDVLVIGGGPAGSTAAALLAERGLDVVLLEKDAHPRFHIGESLLPRSLDILDRLGVRAEIEAMGVHKPGAEFVSDDTGRDVAFAFADGLGQTYGYAYQVLRSDFDAALFRNAARKGARVAERTRVTEVRLAAAGERARVVAAAGGERTARAGAALRARRLRPRHVHGGAAGHQGRRQAQQHRRRVRALSRRGGANRQDPRLYQRASVAGRMVLADSAAGRRDERGLRRQSGGVPQARRQPGGRSSRTACRPARPSPRACAGRRGSARCTPPATTPIARAPPGATGG